MNWQRIVVPCIAAFGLFGLVGCSGSPTTTAPTATVTVVTPTAVASPSAQSAGQQRFDAAIDGLAKLTRQGTAATIIGFARALQCVATPEDWQKARPYADNLYRRVTDKPLPAIESAACDRVKDTLEGKAARFYQEHLNG